MRIPPVPSAAIFVGLVLIAAPPFFPVQVGQAALPAGATIASALNAVTLPIVLAGLFAAAAGIALVGRASPSNSQRSARICATLATAFSALAFLFAAVATALMVEWGMAPAFDAASAWFYLLGAALLFGALLLVRRHLVGGPAARTGTRGATLSAAIAIAALTVTPALAISLGEMAEEAAQDLEIVPFFISVAFYILGILIVGFGLIRLKRHVDQPSQTTMGSGIVALIIGVALLAAPSVINAIGETFGVDATATISRPALD